MPLAGGGAAGDPPAQLLHGRAYERSVVAVALGSDAPIGLGTAHGCRAAPVAPSIVTAAEGSVILELDGRPAESVYLRKLGIEGRRLSDREFGTLAAAHPLAQPELSGDVRLRHVLDRDGSGGLVCATRIPVNAAVHVGAQSVESIVLGAPHAPRAACAQLQGRPAAGRAGVRLRRAQARARIRARGARRAGVLDGLARPPTASRRRWPGSTRAARSAACAERRGIATMRSWSWPSLEGPTGRTDERDEMLRRFVEASRRAEILAIVNSAHSEAAIGEEVTGELCEAFEAEVAFLVVQRAEDAPPDVVGSSGLIGEQEEALLHDPLVIAGLRGEPPEGLDGIDALGIGLRWLAVESFAAESGGRAVVGVGRLYDQPFDPPEIALLRAVAEAAGHALERFWLAAERARSSAGQAALARAARSLGASLEREHVLDALCREVAGAMGADIVNVYFGDASSGLVAVASHGAGGDFTGFRREPGEGLCGQAVRTGRPQISNAYRDDGYIPTTTAALRDVEVGVAVPLHRHEKTDGAMSVGWRSPRWIERADVELAEAFAELASIACRNAEVHADAQRAAMVDGLTGCLNHGAFQTLLREEIARVAGTEDDAGLSLVLIDLFDFKSVNEDHGHPAGDEVLRTVGDLLRGAVRPYDHVARYGGDEFALLLPSTDHEAARPVAQRAVAALSSARRPDGGVLRASSGVVQWRPGETATDLLDRVDRRLRTAKVELRGEPAAPAPREGTGRRVADRRARRLAMAGAIGSRLARQLDVAGDRRGRGRPSSRARSAARRAGSCACTRTATSRPSPPPGRAPARRWSWTQPQDEGAIGRCLRERRPVLRRTGLEGESTVGFELAVPVISGGQLWGALHLKALGDEALAGEDVDFAELVGDHLGAALHTADLYRRLDQAYLGTAEALAAALEAKDDYTADHARSIADLAVAVGRELDLDEQHLRDLRYGAVFHDIGKIAIPDAILNKPAPLTREERKVIETHPIAGEQILAPVPFLSRVRRIVRHDHERWDGTGYPDGLRGPQIPIGARIVFVVDSFHAMVSDRPYRKGMPEEAAREELRTHSGTQFDPTVVDAFLRVLDSVGIGAFFGGATGL